MSLLTRPALTFAFLTSAAIFVPPAPILHADEMKMGAHESEASKSSDTTETWSTINSLRQALALQIGAKDFKPVHETTEQLTGALIRLRETSKDLPPDKLKRVQGAVANLTKALDGAHDAADEGNLIAVQKQLTAIESLMKVLVAQYPVEVVATKTMAMTPSDHAHMKSGSSREPTVQVTFLPAKAPQAGVRVPVIVKLSTKEGRPVTSADLQLAHTKLVHLLIVDNNLNSYTHEHPVETAPGEWSFTFAPRAGGTYAVFADLLPKATGVQEYAKTTVTVAGAGSSLDTSENLTTTVDGYRFDLKIPVDEPLTAKSASLVSVHVTKPDGTAANNLEPIMAAFAHGVGFTSDLSGVLHVHPMGKEPEKESERGGPDLSFHLQPAMAGFFKFYVQVQIDGQSQFAGFGLNAAPAKPAVVSDKADASAAIYVCPMHPEVTSDQPGATCPKCGMSLLAKKS